MRILQLHSDFIEYKPIQKEISQAEEAERKERRLEELVVLFTAVEKGDDESVAQKAMDEIRKFLKKLKVSRILIYPYAHLSNKLATPTTAIKIVNFLEEQAKGAGLETYRAPFGWTKKFTISIKGHPLAEQSRNILPTEVEKKEEEVSEAVKSEETSESFWNILQLSGELIPVEQFDFHNHENLQKFAEYEISQVRASRKMPPHVPLMQRLEIADYEPGSDPGNMRWYPKGRLIKSLLERYVTRKVVEYGGMEVETPVMYDFHHPSLSDYLNRFPARQYILKSQDKELFLRFASCFGQFLMAHDTQFSYKQMPLKLYELARYSFRREQRGEVVGLRRLRAFTMPDCHAFSMDLEKAKKEFITRFKLSMQILEEIGLSREDYEVAIRFTKRFYRENKEFVGSLAKTFGKPALVEMWDKRFFYFVLKWDFNFIDNQNKATALSTDQIDVENAERYDITYVDEEGSECHPLIMHCSPSGAIERCIYALLEKAYKRQKRGEPPMLPLWLSPTQIRIIPMSDQYLDLSRKLMADLEAEGIRVDIDDRSSTMQKRVRKAEREWVPYTIVIGEREKELEVIPVRDRKAGKIRKMNPKDLIGEIKETVEGKPFKSLPLPKYLSKRPHFYG